jgi:hypothetical protein
VNKKVNTVLFILGAAVVNMLTMFIILFLGIYLMGLLLSESARESIGQFMFILVFFVAIGGSFFIYNRLIRYMSKKYDLDKYFHPIFRRRGGDT